MDLVGRVHGFAQRHGLWTVDVPVIAAVSGGADSVALLLILHELAERGLAWFKGVAHLHHHLRAEDADQDAAFVAHLSERLGAPLELAHADVPALARRTGQSVEVAARHARLAFFARLSGSVPGARVAVAHTRTDQAETVLLRLTRGAGSRGLAGMAPRTGHRIRPLLDVSRDELRQWLRARGEAWREDATNEDTAIARNHVRLVVMPQLRKLNPGVEQAVARAARIQAADAELLDELARTEAARLLEVQGPQREQVRVNLSELRRVPEALARRVIRQALLTIDPSRTPRWEDTEAVLRLSTRRLDIGAARLELFGELAVLCRRGPAASARQTDAPPNGAWVVEVPGSLRHPLGWWEVEATGPLDPALATPTVATDGTARAVVDAAALGRHLTIRAWQPGDRVQPLGLGGRKKLQDLFVDRKVPRDERARVAVVLDAHERIAWVAGHVIGEPFRVTPRSEAVVVLTLRR